MAQLSDKRGFERYVGSSLGGYTLERLLGRGGMGAVFAGRHPELGVVRALSAAGHPLADEILRALENEPKARGTSWLARLRALRAKAKE